MFIRHRFLLYSALGLLLLTLVSAGLLYLLPLNSLSIQQKPEQAPQKVYEYYIIMDEANGKTLMYVPLIVAYGDEVLTEDNKLYKVVKIEENRVYARFVKDIKLENYRNKNKNVD